MPQKPLPNAVSHRGIMVKSVEPFLASLKEQGYKFVDAKAQWDESKEKKELLSSISLPELKRRKFVDKTCTVHPWL